MSQFSPEHKRTAHLATCLCLMLAIAATFVAAAQPPRSRRAASARRQEQTKNAPFIYGNITISDYQSLKGTVGVSADYNWLVGARDRVFIGVGGGAKRIYPQGAGDDWFEFLFSRIRSYPTMRFVVGIAF